MGYNTGPLPGWRDVIGERLLIRESTSSGRYPDEVVLLEVSPSGGYVKMRYPNGSESWKDVSWYRIVEVLPARLVVADGATIDLGNEE
jgi:hypothetical protein